MGWTFLMMLGRGTTRRLKMQSVRVDGQSPTPLTFDANKAKPRFSKNSTLLTQVLVPNPGGRQFPGCDSPFRTSLRIVILSSPTIGNRSRPTALVGSIFKSCTQLSAACPRETGGQATQTCATLSKLQHFSQFSLVRRGK